MNKVAVIGYGRFGNSIVELLLKYTKLDVLVVTKKDVPSHPRLTIGTISDLSGVDVVIPCVPISAFSETITSMAPFLKPGCLCIDVCSVKTYPVEIMLKKLPISVSILATHPMFGPASLAKNNGLSGLKIVVHPVRVDQKIYQQIKKFLSGQGLEVVELSPEEHDKYVAFSQMYTFCIGFFTRHMGLSHTPLDTYWFNFMLEQSQVVTNDGDQLFHDILKYNPYTKDFFKKFSHSYTTLSKIIEKEIV